MLLVSYSPDLLFPTGATSDPAGHKFKQGPSNYCVIFLACSSSARSVSAAFATSSSFFE